MPVINTSTPPKPTCRAAESGGVSIYLLRIQLITASSASTTQMAAVMRDVKCRNQERQRMADAAKRRHQAANQAAHPRMAAAGEAAIVGERFGESHADARAHRSRHAHQKRVPRFMGGEAAAKTGASVETEPSIRPARPGCTICSTNSRRLAASSFMRTSAPSFVFFQLLGAVFVRALFLRQVVEQLADVRVLARAAAFS